MPSSTSGEQQPNASPFFQDPNTPATHTEVSGRITAPPTKLGIALTAAKDTALALGAAIIWTSDEILAVGTRAAAVAKMKMANAQKARENQLEGTDLPVIPSASTSGTENRPLVQRDGYTIDKEE